MDRFFLNDGCNVGFSLRRKEMIKWFLGTISDKSVLFLLWTVRTVKGSVQVLRAYLQLSNLDFWVWLQKDIADNNLWLTNKRDPVCTDNLARVTFRIWCVCFTLSLLTGIGVYSVVCQLTRWVHYAQSESTPIMCEVCYLNGESGLLSHMSVSFSTFSSFFCGYVQSTDVTWFKMRTKSFTVGGFPSILNMVTFSTVAELKIPTQCPI